MEHQVIDPDVLAQIIEEFGQDPQPENGGHLQAQPQGQIQAAIEEDHAAASDFRFSAKKAALTFSRCGLGREYIADWFLTKWAKKNKVGWVLVAEEKHHKEIDLVEKEEEEPDTHYHVFLNLRGKLDTRSSKAFDIPGPQNTTYHPNIQKIKEKDGEKRWYEYCTKEDKNWIVRGSLTKEEVKARYEGEGETERDKFGAMLISGQMSLEQFIILRPRELWNFKNLQFGLREFQALKHSVKIADWKPLVTFKKRHYWIWGPSNTGKTTVLRTLIKHRPELWYQMPRQNTDWVCYGGQPYLWIDEYAGQLPIGDLNQICDGGMMANVKGTSSVQLAEWPTVFVLANISPWRCYEKAFERDPLLKESVMNRFIEVDTKDPGWEAFIQVDHIYPEPIAFPGPGAAV